MMACAQRHTTDGMQSAAANTDTQQVLDGGNSYDKPCLGTGAVLHWSVRETAQRTRGVLWGRRGVDPEPYRRLAQTTLQGVPRLCVVYAVTQTQTQSQHVSPMHICTQMAMQRHRDMHTKCRSLAHRHTNTQIHAHRHRCTCTCTCLAPLRCSTVTVIAICCRTCRAPHAPQSPPRYTCAQHRTTHVPYAVGGILHACMLNKSILHTASTRL